MNDARAQLLSDIEEFLRRNNMFATEFGRRVANNTALVTRLRSGLDVRLETADRIRKFMAQYTRAGVPVENHKPPRAVGANKKAKIS